MVLTAQAEVAYTDTITNIIGCNAQIVAWLVPVSMVLAPTTLEASLQCPQEAPQAGVLYFISKDYPKPGYSHSPNNLVSVTNSVAAMHGQSSGHCKCCGYQSTVHQQAAPRLPIHGGIVLTCNAPMVHV